jgi:hypothetical protein
MPTRDHRVNCEVVVPPELAFGVFANAFRVVEASDGRCVLEFLVYSTTGQQAKVVNKVPVRKAFLPVIRDRIATCLRSSKGSRLPTE